MNRTQRLIQTDDAKELASTLWAYPSRVWARMAWLRWYGWAIPSRLDPIKRAARMVKRNLEGILNAIYFHLGGLQLYPEISSL